MSSDGRSRLRQQAERRLAENLDPTALRDSPSLESVVHELQVHEIELELQNEELREANEMLERSRDRYFQLFDAAPVPYLQFDDRSRIQSLNLRATDLLNLSRRHPNFSFINLLAPDSIETFTAHLQRVFETRGRSQCELSVHPHARRRRRDGIPIQMDSVWLEHHSAPRGLCLSTCVDLSEHKLLLAEVREARAEAELSNDLKSQFLANTSHEIRTPMSAIFGYVDLMLKDDPSPKQRQRLEVVLRASQGLLGILDEILDLSRIEQDQLELHSEDFSPAELLAELEQLFRLQARESGVDLHFGRDTELPPLRHGDRDRIRQILVNIINNGLKFTPRGGRVAVATSYRARRLIVRVEDTGNGMTAAERERIFEPFHQVDGSDTRKHSGVGLGLSIVKRLVELMNGAVYVSSRVGEGSTFTVQIPAGPPLSLAPVAAAAGRGAAPRVELRDPSAPAYVLLVDDDRDMRELLTVLVRRLGCEVGSVANGQEALECLERRPADLVLLDMQMPVMDGYETVRRIRRHPLLRDLRVVALTAKALRHEQEACLAEGCDAFLAKPIVFEQLRAELERHLPIAATLAGSDLTPDEP